MTKFAPAQSTGFEFRDQSFDRQYIKNTPRPLGGLL
jgi:hypothetical protein